MLEICSKSIFLYKDQVYMQIDGVAMGSPLAPLLAEWFVTKIENTIFNSNIPSQPLFYRRYVDDTFAMFTSKAKSEHFFNVLNSAHPNLKFTMETSTTSLPFLDASISIKNGKFETRVYRKPTSTGVMIHYNSTAPFKWKRSLIKCLLLRAYRISSNIEIFNSEINIVKTSLMNNAYPKQLIDRITQDFITRHGIDDTTFKKSQANLPDKPSTTNKTYFTIPYLGKPSLRFQRKLKRNFQDSGLEVEIAYNTTKIGSYFGLKTRTPYLFKSNVVYKFTCTRDENITYIGESKRQLYQRIKDHCEKDKNSAIFGHLYECANCQDEDIISRFEILKCGSSMNILSLEAILITKLRPSLNTQLGPQKGTLVSLTLYK